MKTPRYRTSMMFTQTKEKQFWWHGALHRMVSTPPLPFQHQWHPPHWKPVKRGPRHGSIRTSCNSATPKPRSSWLVLHIKFHHPLYILSSLLVSYFRSAKPSPTWVWVLTPTWCLTLKSSISTRTFFSTLGTSTNSSLHVFCLKNWYTPLSPPG